MIKCEKGQIEICGDLKEIRVDLSTIVNSLYNEVPIPKPILKDMIMEAVERGFMTKEELEKRIEEKKSTIKELDGLVGDFFSGLSDLLKKGGKDNGSDK